MDKQLRDALMRAEAAEALNADLEEENERLRAENATLKDKLSQKEERKPQGERSSGQSTLEPLPSYLEARYTLDREFYEQSKKMKKEVRGSGEDYREPMLEVSTSRSYETGELWFEIKNINTGQRYNLMEKPEVVLFMPPERLESYLRSRAARVTYELKITGEAGKYARERLVVVMASKLMEAV